MRKFYWIVIVVFAVSLGLYGIFFSRFSGHYRGKEMILRVAFVNRSFKISSFDPARIEVAPEWDFLSMIYSPLVELAPDGVVVDSLAKAEWRGAELHLEMREDLRTIDGIPITVEDAAFSLKRLLVKSSNTHGNLQDFLCSGRRLRSVDEDCPGIRVEKNTLILTPSRPGDKTFIQRLLTNMDFVVIPRSSTAPNTLSIKEYRNTSGLYYVDREGEEKIHLKVNPAHFHYSPAIAQEVILVRSHLGYPSSIERFEAGKVDLILNTDKEKSSRLLEFAKNRSDTDYHHTINIKTTYLLFLERGEREISVDRRRAIAAKVREAYRIKHVNLPGYESAEQFFPVFGEGGLTSEQLKILRAAYQSVDHQETGISVLLGVTPDRMESFKDIYSQTLPDLKYQATPNLPIYMEFKSPKEMPHIFIHATDSSFYEDISLLSYCITSKMFGSHVTERKAWLEQYLKIEDKPTRLKMLRELHLKLLKEAILVPIATYPYVAVARKPWQIHFSKYYAGSPLWLVTRE